MSLFIYFNFFYYENPITFLHSPSYSNYVCFFYFYLTLQTFTLTHKKRNHLTTGTWIMYFPQRCQT